MLSGSAHFLMPDPEVGVSVSLPFRDGGFMSGEIKGKKCIIKNLVGPVGQGKVPESGLY